MYVGFWGYGPGYRDISGSTSVLSMLDSGAKGQDIEIYQGALVTSLCMLDSGAMGQGIEIYQGGLVSSLCWILGLWARI